MDEKKSIAIEVICRKNYEKLGGVDPDSVDIVDRDGHEHGFINSSVRTYDFKDAAEYVAAQAKKQGKNRVLFGVFYDPLAKKPRPVPAKEGEKVDRKAEWKKQEKQRKKESEKQLRQQRRTSSLG